MKAIEMMTDAGGITTEIIDVNHTLALVGNTCWEKGNLKPHTRYACCMVEIPEGYRLANDEDKECDKPQSALFLNNSYWDSVSNDSCWGFGNVYIVPIADKNAELVERLRKAEEEVAAVRKELGNASK